MKALNSSIFYQDPEVTIPQRWSLQTLPLIFNQTLGLAQVMRDFDVDIASQGDRVTIQTPVKTKAKRLKTGEDIVPDQIDYTEVDVDLNHHIYVSYTVKDILQSLSAKAVINDFLLPSAKAISQRIDRLIFSTVHQFPTLGKVGTPISLEVLTQLRTYATRQGWSDQRFLNCTPEAVAPMYSVDKFTTIDKISGGGTALRTAVLGQLLTFIVVDSNNLPHIAPGDVQYATALVVDGDIAVGSTTLEIVSGTALVVGQIVLVDGQVKEVASVTSSVIFEMTEAFTEAVLDGKAVMVPVKPVITNTVDKNSVKLRTYDGEYQFTGYTNLPVVGQQVNFVNGTEVDRNAVEDTQVGEITPADVVELSAANMYMGTHGDYNLVLTDGAIAFVTRPLELPDAAYVDSYVANFEGLGLRVTRHYSANTLGGANFVKFDMLAGIKVINPKMGVRLIS